jgi:hypothetical protein
MWPFSKGEQIKSAFGKFIDKDIVEALQNEPGQLQEKQIEYVLLLLDSHELIGRAIEIISNHDSMIESITGTLITTLVGAPLENSKSEEIRRNLVKQLSAELGPNAVVLHGRDSCLVGMVGNNQRMSYTAVIPDYKMKLLRISSGEYGEVIEV